MPHDSMSFGEFIPSTHTLTLSSTAVNEQLGLQGAGSEQTRNLTMCDIDGDGKDELIVGAPLENSNGGKIDVIHGTATIPTSIDLAASPWFVINGPSGAKLGAIIHCAQVQGSAQPEVILPTFTGADFWLVDVKAEIDAVHTSITLNASASVTNGTYVNVNLATANGFDVGNINGDAYKDIIVCKMGAAANGVCHGFLGTSGTVTTNAFDVDPSGSNDEYFGKAVSIADVDGDGYGDLVIGANADDPQANGGYKGSWNVYFGASNPTGTLSLGFSIYHPNSSGTSCGHAESGDLDNDGRDDLILISNNSSVHEKYVVWGRALSGWQNPALPNNSLLGTPYLSVPTSSRFASTSGIDDAAIRITDHDGDGKLDLVLGDFANNGGIGIIRHRTVTVPSDRDFWTGGFSLTQLMNNVADGWITNAEAGSEFGRSLTVGDFNGDGTKEIVGVAALSDNACVNCGEMTMVFFKFPSQYDRTLKFDNVD